MDTLLTPAAADVWPKAYPVTSYRLSGGRLTLEVPGLSEAPLLTCLSHAIHLEMRAAGEWAARIGEPRDGLLGPKDFHRLRLDTAARLLAIYTALHGSASYISTLDLAPDALKASASRCYETALRGEQAQRQESDKSIFPPVSTGH